MALWALRWERYARDFEGLPLDERSVLDQEGIAIKTSLVATSPAHNALKKWGRMLRGCGLHIAA